MTTVVLARRASREGQPHVFSGGILIASGVMYVRLAVLLALFNRDLMNALAPSFIALGASAICIGAFWSRRGDAGSREIKREFEPHNPLELRAAFLFALLFLAMLIATQLAVSYLGSAGVYALAAIMGVTDVDPFIMGMTQAAAGATPLHVAAAGILVAAASNNVVKGAYACILSSRAGGIQSFCLLAGLAALGLTPWLWL